MTEQLKNDVIERTGQLPNDHLAAVLRDDLVRSALRRYAEMVADGMTENEAYEEITEDLPTFEEVLDNYDKRTISAGGQSAAKRKSILVPLILLVAILIALVVYVIQKMNEPQDGSMGSVEQMQAEGWYTYPDQRFYQHRGGTVEGDRLNVITAITVNWFHGEVIILPSTDGALHIEDSFTTLGNDEWCVSYLVPNSNFKQDTLAIEYRMPYRSMQELIDNGKVKTLTLRIPPEMYVPIDIKTVTATVDIDNGVDFESVTINGDLQK
jgi:hypothetical protein